jgi:hypothetical protein
MRIVFTTGATGVEPAISGLTGRRVNHYTTPPNLLGDYKKVFRFWQTITVTGEPGFEPGYTAPKAAVLPLDDSPTECRGPDLNWGPFDFQSNALPTELPRREPSQLWQAVVYHVAEYRSSFSPAEIKQIV